MASIFQTTSGTDSQLADVIRSEGRIAQFTAQDLQAYRTYLRGKISEPLFRKIYNVREVMSNNEFLDGLSYKQDLEYVVAKLITSGLSLGKIRSELGDEEKQFVGLNIIFDLMVLDLFECRRKKLREFALTLGITMTDDYDSLELLLKSKSNEETKSIAVAQFWLDAFVEGEYKNPNLLNTSKLRYVMASLSAYADERSLVRDPRARANFALSPLGNDYGSMVVSATMGWKLGGLSIADMIDRGYEKLFERLKEVSPTQVSA